MHTTTKSTRREANNMIVKVVTFVRKGKSVAFINVRPTNSQPYRVSRRTNEDQFMNQRILSIHLENQMLR